jgi:hypothetical protein
MRDTHTVRLVLPGSIRVTNCSIYVIAEPRSRGNFDNRGATVTMCDTMRSDAKLTRFTATARGPSPQAGLARFLVTARIAEFLDGRTCGEDLLHALYDHVLDEPIPQPIREILNKCE